MLDFDSPCNLYPIDKNLDGLLRYLLAKARIVWLGGLVSYFTLNCIKMGNTFEKESIDIRGIGVEGHCNGIYNVL
jgi:hypothetical protein